MADPIIVIRGDLKQRDVRNLELEAIDVGHEYLNSPISSSKHEAFLKAAIGAGWIESPECKKATRFEDKKRIVEYYFDGVLVDDLDPRVCYAAGEVVIELMVEFTSLVPNSSSQQQTPEAEEK